MASITIQDSGRGPVYSFGSVNWHSPDRAIGFGEEPIRNLMLGLSKVHTAISADTFPERVPEKLFDRMGGNVAAVTRMAIEDGRGEARAAQEADGRIMEPARPVDPALAADVWGAYRSMDPGARANAIEQADLTDLTALVGFGNRVPLDPQMWARAVERYRVENWIVKANYAANHPAAVTIEQPLATAPTSTLRAALRAITWTRR